MSFEKEFPMQAEIELGNKVKSVSDNELSLVPVMATTTLKHKYDHEKKLLDNLNERLAKYIERVKFLECQNKKFLADLDSMKNLWGHESKAIKKKFEPELEDARLKIESCSQEKAVFEIKSKRSEYGAFSLKKRFDNELAYFQKNRSKINQLQFVLQENQSELEILRKKLSTITSDVDKYNKQISKLDAELDKLLIELDKEIIARFKVENEKQTIEEQIPFLNDVHEKELEDMRSLFAIINTDPSAFYRHELEKAIRDIRADFTEISALQKIELDKWYTVKLEDLNQMVNQSDSHILEENTFGILSAIKVEFDNEHKEYEKQKRINLQFTSELTQLEENLESIRNINKSTLLEKQTEINDIKIKLEELLVNYDELMCNKNSLVFELGAYTRLLDNEENLAASGSEYFVEFLDSISSIKKNTEPNASITETTEKID